MIGSGNGLWQAKPQADPRAGRPHAAPLLYWEPRPTWRHPRLLVHCHWSHVPNAGGGWSVGYNSPFMGRPGSSAMTSYLCELSKLLHLLENQVSSVKQEWWYLADFLWELEIIYQKYSVHNKWYILVLFRHFSGIHLWPLILEVFMWGLKEK